MKKKDWKAARKRLELADKQPAKNFDMAEFLRKQDGVAKSRTLYHREYARFRRHPAPTKKECPMCRTTFFLRKEWRQLENTWVCKFCFVLLDRRTVGSRYLVDIGQLINIFGKYENFSVDALAEKLGISGVTLRKIFSGEVQHITKATYRRLRAAQPSLQFTKNWVFHAPAALGRMRGKAGWTQEQAAGFLGITRSEYGRIESGRRAIQPDYLDELLLCLKSLIDSASTPTKESLSPGEKESGTDTDSLLSIPME